MRWLDFIIAIKPLWMSKICRINIYILRVNCFHDFFPYNFKIKVNKYLAYLNDHLGCDMQNYISLYLSILLNFEI